jgi:hypothetical protein
MKLQRLASFAVILLCASASVDGARADPGNSPTAPSVGFVTGHKYARLKIGVSTQTDVRSLLGPPWRTIQYNDLDERENEIWEYRGTDSRGSYRLHIEFDRHAIVQVLAKVPDNPTGER